MKVVEQQRQRSRAIRPNVPSLSLGGVANIVGSSCARLENPLGISLTVALKRAREHRRTSSVMRRHIRTNGSPKNWQRVPRSTVCNTVASALLNDFRHLYVSPPSKEE